MLRNRNSFFQESSQSSAFNIPNPVMNSMPYQSAQAGMSFYTGPNFNQNNSFEEVESRLSKIERQLNRLDARISKLENNSKLESIDINNSMYMV